MSKIKKNLLKVVLVFKRPKYAMIALITGVVVALFYSIIYGLIKISFLFVNLRTSPITFFDYSFIAVSSILAGATISLSAYSKFKKNLAGGGGLFFGFGAGMVGVLCPLCLGVNLLVFGGIVSAPLALLVPYIRWIQAGALAFLGTAFWLSTKNIYNADCEKCEG